MEDWIKDLKYLLMQTRHPVPGYEKEYQLAYEIWREAWNKFRREMHVEEFLHSDGFLAPDEIGLLLYKNECVGFTCFTYGNFNGPLKDLGWFKAWTPEAMEALADISRDIVICTQFTVNPKFAGKDQIVRWKDIVSLYTLLRFEHSDAGVMAGQLNLTRGMQNASGENSGATVLDPCHPFNYFGVEIPAQLVAYERHNIEAMKEQKNIVGLCDDLWTKLVHLSEFPVRKKILPFKKVA